MIYLDCAATSLQKPAAVRYAVSEAVRSLSSPGRGGYESAMAAADVLLDCRMALSEMFSVKDPERVIFTSSATHGLNIAIKSLVSAGDKVVVSGYEHNAVMRPLVAVGADVHVAASPLFAPKAAIEAFRKALPGAKAAVCCHVSNVFGYILPVAEIAALCREMGVPLIVDASQSAGCLALDFDGLGCDFAAMPGHKGLLGPQGTGVLLCKSMAVKTLIEGGTGSMSEPPEMPDIFPDRLEAGTHNMPGVAGLLAGVRWLQGRIPGALLRHESALCRRMAEALSGSGDIELFAAEEEQNQAGVLSVRFRNMDCEEAAQRLGERGIAVRAGLHCAPSAHRTAGTLETGTVRFSFSPFTTEREVLAAAQAALELQGKQR